MKCPNCGLFNPDEAERCDCGYDFKTATLQRSYLPQRNDSKAIAQANRDIAIGGAVFLLGLIATIGSYLLVADTGGAYIIAWGAILFGALRIVRGFARRS